MEEVIIITRDKNDKRSKHYLRWDDVVNYITSTKGLIEETILLVILDDMCLYNALQDNYALGWYRVVSFFA